MTSMVSRLLRSTVWLSLFLTVSSHAAPVKIGLIHPTTGRYQHMGFDMAQGAILAVEEINRDGGILGQPIELLTANTASHPEQGQQAVRSLIQQGATFTMGAAASDVAIAAGKTAAKQDRLFFAALSYANETTGVDGHRHIFRETTNSWMTAKALSFYLGQKLKDQRIFYVTADYSWGRSLESSIRKFTDTKDTQTHRSVLTSYPRPRHSELQSALQQAAASDADILMLSLLGGDMVSALQLAHNMGLKDKMEIVVPNLTQSMANDAGPSIMEGIVGTVPWYWQVPYQFGHPRGQAFVEAYLTRFDEYPDSPAASAYSILYQIREAAERAGSFNTDAMIQALEGHHYMLLKDPQHWRQFDHQNVQSTYVVRAKARDEVMRSERRGDLLDILLTLPGNMGARSYEEWSEARSLAGKTASLEH